LYFRHLLFGSVYTVEQRLRFLAHLGIGTVAGHRFQDLPRFLEILFTELKLGQHESDALIGPGN